MGPIGMPEMVIIFIVALMLFGPKELPKIGRTVAKTINDFKRASNELKDTWQRELNDLERDPGHPQRNHQRDGTDFANHVQLRRELLQSGLLVRLRRLRLFRDLHGFHLLQH